MTLRQLCGFILGGVGVWMMWQAGMGMAQYIEASNGMVSLAGRIVRASNGSAHDDGTWCFRWRPRSAWSKSRAARGSRAFRLSSSAS